MCMLLLLHGGMHLCDIVSDGECGVVSLSIRQRRSETHAWLSAGCNPLVFVHLRASCAEL